ncbi:hypothetical protein BH11BAC1_BH11BAC1_05700 [soil metagenome]
MLVQAQIEQEKKVLTEMMSACENLKSASFILSTTERDKSGKVEKGELFVKQQRNPMKMYVHMYAPRVGIEILYRKGDWNNNLYISPHSFPYVNLKLSPNNMLVRAESHHTVCEIGFDYLMKMIGHYKTVMGEKLYDYLQLGDTVTFDTRRCIRMDFDYPEFGYSVQTLREGENIVDIAARYFTSEYMIVCANKEVKDIEDSKAGQQLRIPNMFGRKIIFYIDLRTKLPLMQEIHDENGFFEKYEYNSFLLNPGFDPAEFTSGYKDYGF